MSGINKVILVGHLGKDPEIRTFENGSKKASFSLATSEYRKDMDGNRVEMTEWHNIVMWANTFLFLSPKEASSPTVTQVPNQTAVIPTPPPQQPAPPESKVPEENFADDLPF